MAATYQPTERTRLRRLAERGVYDRATVHSILDEGFICHVAFTIDGQPYALPTGYARVGETIYLHGSSGGRLGLRPGMPVCVTVTLLDGVVLARAAFHHSFNYRSAMVLGRTRLVTGPGEKERALSALVEHIVPGRGVDVRLGDAKELAATAVLAVPLEEASAKVRRGDPEDEEEDYALPAWAGVVPLALAPGDPVADARLDPAVAVPPYVAAWRRGSACASGGGASEEVERVEVGGSRQVEGVPADAGEEGLHEREAHRHGHDRADGLVAAAEGGQRADEPHGHQQHQVAERRAQAGQRALAQGVDADGAQREPADGAVAAQQPGAK